MAFVPTPAVALPTRKSRSPCPCAPPPSPAPTVRRATPVSPPPPPSPAPNGGPNDNFGIPGTTSTATTTTDAMVTRWSPVAALGGPTSTTTTAASEHPECAVALRECASAAEVDTAVSRVYAQVFGEQGARVASGDAAGVSGDEMVARGEELLRAGLVTVRGFVAMVAKSTVYRDLFFARNSQVRFIELNFKHLLGRAPSSQEEIARHVLIYSEGGYEAEMDSYVESEEYMSRFGENVVPYMQGSGGVYRPGVGATAAGYNRTRKVMSARDFGTQAAVFADVVQGRATAAPDKVMVERDIPRYFSVRYVSGEAVETNTIAVPFLSLSRKVSLILRCGGEILNIAPIEDAVETVGYPVAM